MASHVVVIDSTARRATVKTTPNKPLSDVLEEACSKLGLKAEQYGLKNNNKQVDLSRTFRLSSLSSGAKLELVQLSKSAGVVSVALQLPESEAAGAPNGRLTDKFSSSTTLWLVLRKFEAGVAGAGSGGRNLTAKGAPSTGAGAGRLYYQQPALQIMNRELSSFTDLQKTLAQIGLNSGSALLRLSFRQTEQPLEEAMERIQQYFNEVDGVSSTQPQSLSEPSVAPLQESTNQLPSPDPTPTKAEPSARRDIDPKGTEAERPEWEHDNEPEGPQPLAAPSEPQHSEPAIASPTTSSGRPVSVYRPPSSSTPSAAQMSHNDADYTPTVEHAQAHQKMLNQSSRNVRLPTEAEIAAQQQEEAEKLAAVKEVEIKVRFPDQSAVSSKFGQADTAASLYSFVKECLDPQFQSQPFFLRVPSNTATPRNKGAQNTGNTMETIPQSEVQKLIKDIQLKGRVLIVFAWDDTQASTAARGTKNVLKGELRARAEDVKVPQDVPSSGPEEKGVRVNIGTAGDQEKGEGSGGGLGKKMPKWLKGLGKK